MNPIRTKLTGIPLKELSNELKISFVRVFAILWKNRFYTNADPEGCLDSDDYEEAKRILKNNLQRD